MGWVGEVAQEAARGGSWWAGGKAGIAAGDDSQVVYLQPASMMPHTGRPSYSACCHNEGWEKKEGCPATGSMG